MAEYQELIKNFNKIRDVSKHFLIYGIDSRNSQTLKSKRSYDNEKRRLESFLPSIIQSEMTPKGKKVFITINPQTIYSNPLFALWETKSFTRFDISLYFLILDILKRHPYSDVNQIYDILLETYFVKFGDCKLPDPMTVRNKLKDFEKSGYISKKKEGKAYLYALADQPLLEMSLNEQNAIGRLCTYFSNTAPLGILGHQLSKKIGNAVQPAITYKQYFIFHTLDDGILSDLFQYMNEEKEVLLTYKLNRSGKTTEKRGLPIKILSNVSHGRRYVVLYETSKKSYASLRIDKIEKVKALKMTPQYGQRVQAFHNLKRDSWGGIVQKQQNLETVSVTLYIHEKHETFILDRIEREGQHGTLKRICENTFEFQIDVIDTMEMVPWLRTFIGRIIEIKGTNAPVIDRFKADLQEMYSMYSINEGD